LPYGSFIAMASQRTTYYGFSKDTRRSTRSNTKKEPPDTSTGKDDFTIFLDQEGPQGNPHGHHDDHQAVRDSPYPVPNYLEPTVTEEHLQSVFYILKCETRVHGPFFFFWWGLLHGPQQGPDRMKEKPIRLGKGKLLPKQKNPP